MKPKELEKWYDYTYRNYMLSLLAIEKSNYKNVFDELKRKITGT